MKQILLGSPANTVSISLTDFICNSPCSDWKAEEEGGLHLHEALVWQQGQEGSLNLVCDQKNGVSPQWLTSPLRARIDEFMKSRYSVALALYPRSIAPIHRSSGLL